MRKLKLEMQVSIDGFAADANGGTSWMIWNWLDDWKWDDRLRQFHINLTTSSDCLLLSRKMAEEGFHHHWETVAQDPNNPQFDFAKPITDMKKLVFTTTLAKSSWPNTELAKGDIAKEVNRLKSAKGKDILVYGGLTFASALITAGLIDEFYLFVNPTALGVGRSMFKDISAPLPLDLQGATAYECGVVVFKYARRN
jgi:dihydrofolate reductase